MVSGHEVATDGQREGEYAAGLHLVLVAADLGEQFTQVGHPPVIDAAQALGDRRVTPSPVADGEVDVQQVGGEGKRARPPHPDPHVAALALDMFEGLIGCPALPGVEHLREERVPVGEMTVEATLCDTELVGQDLDPDRTRPAGREGLQARLDPLTAGRTCDGRHGLPLVEGIERDTKALDLHYTVAYIWSGRPLVPVAPGAEPDERPDEGSVDRAYDRGREHSVAFLLPHPGAGMLAEQDEVKRYRWSARVNLDGTQMLCVEVAVLLRADQAQRRAVRKAQRLVVETVSEQDILLQSVFDGHDRPVAVEAAEDDMRHCRSR